MAIKTAQQLGFDPAEARIVIVDSYAQVRKSLKKEFERLGIKQIHDFHSVAECIHHLKDNAADLIICDLYLGEQTGFEILEFVRSSPTNTSVPIIILSGEASREEVVKAIDLGANDYFLKPFVPEEFIAKATLWLKKHMQPTETNLSMREAEKLFLLKNYSAASLQVEFVLKTNPKYLPARFLYAVILDRKDKTEDAQKALHSILADSPDYFKAHGMLADIYLRAKQFDTAIQYLSSELQFNPKQPRRQAKLGYIQLERGKIPEAIECFRHALVNDQRYLVALFGMGQAYAAAKNLEKSIYYYKRARRYYPTNSECLEKLVQVCIDAGEPKKAEFMLRDEKSTNKDRLDTYTILANFYKTTGQEDKAKAVLEELSAKTPPVKATTDVPKAS